MTRVLFVCMGNICRSPTAEGVFAQRLREHRPALDVEVDSAGTHGYHVGDPPDPRAVEAARRRGIDIAHLRARRVSRQDFERFDLIVAMDRENRDALRELAPPQAHERIRLLLEFSPDAGREDVPDPYYGGATGFDLVLDLVEAAADGLLAELDSRLNRRPSRSGR